MADGPPEGSRRVYDGVGLGGAAQRQSGGEVDCAGDCEPREHRSREGARECWLDRVLAVLAVLADVLAGVKESRMKSPHDMRAV